LLNQSRSSSQDMFQRSVSRQSAAGIGRYSVPQPSQQVSKRLPERLTLYIPQRHIDGGKREGHDTAGSGSRCRATQLAPHRFNSQRIFTHGQFSHPVYSLLQRRSERPAEKGKANSFNAVVGSHPHGDKFKRPVKSRATGQGFFGGQTDDLRLYAFDFHDLLSAPTRRSALRSKIHFHNRWMKPSFSNS